MIVGCKHCRDNGGESLRIDSVTSEADKVTIKLHCEDCLEHTDIVIEHVGAGKNKKVDLEFMDKMWVKGWMLGKYDKFQGAPATNEEINQWTEGFQKGCAELARYDEWLELLKEFAAEHPELNVVLDWWKV